MMSNFYNLDITSDSKYMIFKGRRGYGRMMDMKIRYFNKVCKQGIVPHCIVCNGAITYLDLRDVEMNVTKRKSVIFVHKNCLKKGKQEYENFI